jgi:hypothetical protein
VKPATLSCFLFSAVAATTIGASAQAPARPTAPAAARTGKGSTARTPSGDPDLEGVWNYGTATPLERPAQWVDKPVLTEAEAAAYEKQNAERRGGTNVTAGPDWWEPQNGILKNRRTSLIVDPPDGRLPPAAPAAGRGGRGGRAGGQYENPEELGLQDRCIAWPAAAPPYTPTVYNNNIGIIQTKDYVVLQSEMIHVARIVHMNGTHGTMPSMYGDSIGHWDGTSLVVDTINFNGRINYRNTGDHLHLIERFTRTGAGTLEYRFTVDDPSIWSRSWTAMIDMTKIDQPIYEFACHEGNSISMIGTLKGARMAEQENAQNPPSAPAGRGGGPGRQAGAGRQGAPGR